MTSLRPPDAALDAFLQVQLARIKRDAYTQTFTKGQLIEPPPFVRDLVPHGSLTGYTKHGCRCKACRQAMALYSQEARARRREHGICQECSRPASRGRCDVHLASHAERRRKRDAKKKAQRLRWRAKRAAKKAASLMIGAQQPSMFGEVGA